MENLNNIKAFNLIGIYKTLHPTMAKYTFFPSINGRLTETDNNLGHKTCLNKYEKTSSLYILGQC